MQYNNDSQQPQLVFYEPPASEIEKKDIRIASNRIGAAFLISIAAVFVISTVISLVFVINRAKYILSSPTVLVIMQLVLSVIMFVPPFYILARISRFRIGDLLVHRHLPASDLIWFVSFGLMMSMLANIVVGYIGNIIESLGLSLEYETIEMPQTVGGCILWAITLSVVPALVEEFAMRAVILGTLRRFGDVFAIIISAALFGLMHGNIVQIPFAFILGLVFAYITVITGSIIPAIIIHFINNFYSCISEVVSKFCADAVIWAVNYGIFIMFIVIGIIGCRMLSKKGYFSTRLYKSGSGLSNSKRMLSFLCTPCMIISVLIYVFEALVQLIPGKIL